MSLWTPQKIRQLKSMWARGDIVSDIAMALGEGFSLGSVAGKAMRLGLAKRNNRSKNGEAKRQKAVRPQKQKIDLNRIELFCEPISVLEFAAGKCKFAVRPHLGLRKGFCGAETKPGKSFCEFHQQICYPKRTPNPAGHFILRDRVAA